MIKSFRIIALLALSIFAISIFAGSVFADPVEKADAFVCPHLGGKAGENPHSPWQNPSHPQYAKFGAIWEGYTVGGPDVSVPDIATNWGTPGTPHGVPGMSNYTAIWNRAN